VGRVVASDKPQQPYRRQQDSRARADRWPAAEPDDDIVLLGECLLETWTCKPEWRKDPRNSGEECRHPGGHVERVRPDRKHLREQAGHPPLQLARARGGLRQGGDGAGLDDEEFPSGPGRLNILWAPEVPLDGRTNARKPPERRVRKLRNVRNGRSFDVLCATVRSRLDDHLTPPRLPLGDAPAPPSLLQDEVVGGDQAGDDRLAEPRAGVDNHLVPRPRYRVGGEQHAGDLSGHHALDHHGELHRLLVDLLAIAIGDGAIGPKRGPAAPNGVEERLLIRDVQEGVLLTGEGCLREVFGRRA
jgi:hypothetical protein